MSHRPPQSAERAPSPSVYNRSGRVNNSNLRLLWFILTYIYIFFNYSFVFKILIFPCKTAKKLFPLRRVKQVYYRVVADFVYRIIIVIMNRFPEIYEYNGLAFIGIYYMRDCVSRLVFVSLSLKESFSL